MLSSSQDSKDSLHLISAIAISAIIFAIVTVANLIQIKYKLKYEEAKNASFREEYVNIIENFSEGILIIQSDGNQVQLINKILKDFLEMEEGLQSVLSESECGKIKSFLSINDEVKESRCLSKRVFKGILMKDQKEEESLILGVDV